MVLRRTKTRGRWPATQSTLDSILGDELGRVGLSFECRSSLQRRHRRDPDTASPSGLSSCCIDSDVEIQELRYRLESAPRLQGV